MAPHSTTARLTPDTPTQNESDQDSTPSVSDSSTPGLPSTEDSPLRAAHTPNFPALLRRLGASLRVTTYQAGKLVMVRDEGDHLNAHFRAFPASPSPSGWPRTSGPAACASSTCVPGRWWRCCDSRRPCRK